MGRCAAVAFVLGCGGATVENLPDLRSEDWPHDTLLLAGSVAGRLIGPVQVLPWDDDSLIVSDAITGQLLWIDLQRQVARPVSERNYRPFAPTVVERLSDSLLLVGIPPEGMEVVDLVTGASDPIAVPESNTGIVQVGRFAIDDTGAVIMAPWSMGAYRARRATTAPTQPGLVRFDATAGVIHERFGPVLDDHAHGLVPSIEDQVALAIIEPDSLLMLFLFSAQAQVYPLNATHRPRSFSIPQSFIARKTTEPQAPSRTVFAQFQLSDAVATRSGIIAVLRHRNYVWNEWNPFLRRRGDWRPLFALELYSMDGQPARATAIAGSYWRAVRLTQRQDALLLISPGDGVSPTEPVVLRYPIE